MAPKLYGDIRSPCVRAVLLMVEAMKIDVEYVAIDVVKREHLTEEYLRINPRHTVPSLEDEGFTLWDSHAIMTYLAEKYGKNNPLYPLDVQKRAVINQMLYFETGDIFAIHRFITSQVLHKGSKDAPKEAAASLEKAYEFLETFLNQTKFVAGNKLTIADYSFWTSLTNAQYLVPIDKDKYPKITMWIKEMESLPYSKINREGAEEFNKFVDNVLRMKANA